jgi:hypothetical protein
MGEARPYLEPTADGIRAGAWRLVTGEREEPLPEWIAAWDVSQKLRARRQIGLDLDRVFADTRLPRESRLAVSVVYASELEDEARRILLEQEDGDRAIEIEIELDGNALGSAVTLQTSLVLAEPGSPDSGLVAWRRGSVLWQESKKIRLYGDSSQFPLMEIDFKDFDLDPASPWFVQIGSDLELPAMGSILLLLNQRFTLVTEAAKELDADRPELAVVRSALYADVGRILAETALSHEDIGREWPDESLGAVLKTLVATRFSQPPDELRVLRDSDPAEWAALLEARFGLLREPLR